MTATNILIFACFICILFKDIPVDMRLGKITQLLERIDRNLDRIEEERRLEKAQRRKNDNER